MIRGQHYSSESRSIDRNKGWLVSPQRGETANNRTCYEVVMGAGDRTWCEVVMGAGDSVKYEDGHWQHHHSPTSPHNHDLLSRSRSLITITSGARASEEDHKPLRRSWPLCFPIWSNYHKHLYWLRVITWPESWPLIGWERIAFTDHFLGIIINHFGESFPELLTPLFRQSISFKWRKACRNGWSQPCTM